MAMFRRLVRRHSGVAALIVALALCVRLLVPAGYMPSFGAGVMTVQLCSGAGPQTVTIALPMKGDRGQAQHHGPMDQHVDQPCAYAGLATPGLSAADPLLLAVAIAFVMALAFRRTSRRTPARRTQIRPPLRGPPATI